ncbi:ATP-binding protein [Aurantimonas coralicida]|uniref:ATP-binding protein n=2 Tax=Aurantimonas coralicida TaxID=182270 RepID=UPI00351870CB|tara:strand:+ start:2125 stop:2427 length:303 start_codon:yes stop_codon:yes gene_type:complete
MSKDAARQILDQGSLPFTIESRLIRELGERLVRQPDVAMLELVKNSYDADATECAVTVGNDRLVISDDGNGMNFADFRDGWMRLGTSSKGTARAVSPASP